MAIQCKPRPPPQQQKDGTKKKKKTLGDTQPIVNYEDPDLKVVIRLLPPNMSEEAFLLQIPKEYQPTINGTRGLRRFYFQRGSASTKPFEEPNFSRAYFQFQEKQDADHFKSEMEQIVFEDPASGDRVKCEMMKPLFGTVIETTSEKSEGKILQETLYKKFISQRSANATDIDMVKLIKSLHSEDNKRRREKNKSKKAASANTKPESAPETLLSREQSKTIVKPPPAALKKKPYQECKKEKDQNHKKSDKDADLVKKDAKNTKKKSLKAKKPTLTTSTKSLNITPEKPGGGDPSKPKKKQTKAKKSKGKGSPSTEQTQATHKKTPSQSNKSTTKKTT